MITASHNPAAYTGAKLVRAQVAAALGRLGNREIRDLVVADDFAAVADAVGVRRRGRRDGRVPAPRARLHQPRGGQADQGRRRRRQRHGRPDGRTGARRAAGRRPQDFLLDPRRQLSGPRAEPAAPREPRVHHREGQVRRRRSSVSPGTATPTAASSSTSRAASSTATS